MKHWFKLGSLIALVFVLAACGTNDGTSTPQPSSTDAPSGTTDTTTTDETAFTSTLTGAAETTLNGRGYFMCDDEGGELVIGANGGLSNNILITLPRDASAGTTYEIVSEIMEAGQANALYVGSSDQESYYDDNLTGSVTLDAVPSQEGERVAGRFEFSASNNDDATVNATGSFDFTAGPDSFFNCGGE